MEEEERRRKRSGAEITAKALTSPPTKFSATDKIFLRQKLIAGVVFNFLYPSSFNYCLNPPLPAGQSLHNDFWERELQWGEEGVPQIIGNKTDKRKRGEKKSGEKRAARPSIVPRPSSACCKTLQGKGLALIRQHLKQPTAYPTIALHSDNTLKLQQHT